MDKPFTAPTPGAVTFAAEAACLELQVTADPGVTTAEVRVSGPAEAVEAVRAEMTEHSTWRLTFPREGAAGGITGVQAGGGSVITGGVFCGNVVMTGRRVTINGVDVTGGAGRGCVRTAACGRAAPHRVITGRPGAGRAHHHPGAAGHAGSGHELRRRASRRSRDSPRPRQHR